MPPTDQWTDERLDDLKETMESQFDKLDKDIRELRTYLIGGFLATVVATIVAAVVANLLIA